MGVIEFAQENFFISLVVVLGIGFLQGAILARGIRKRFPKFKMHARIVSAVLLILFFINAVLSIVKFAVPDKVSLSDLVVPATPQEGISLMMRILGLNAGFGTTIGVFVSIILIMLFRFAQIPTVARHFMFAISFVMLALVFLVRFTEYVPSEFEIIMYAVYQFGLTLGIFIISRRNESDQISDLE